MREQLAWGLGVQAFTFTFTRSLNSRNMGSLKQEIPQEDLKKIAEYVI